MSDKQDKLNRISEVMALISKDMEKDVKEFTGKPFTGRTLGELHGILAATIAAIADSIKQIVDEELLK